MALPTYGQIAAQLNIPRCRGILPNGQRCYAAGNHQTGFVADGLVHFADRERSERAGIRRFLVLEGRRRAGDVEPWRQLYQSLRGLPYLAAELHLKLPAELGEADRIKLKAMLAKVRPEPERSEALSWLSRVS